MDSKRNERSTSTMGSKRKKQSSATKREKQSTARMGSKRKKEGSDQAIEAAVVREKVRERGVERNYNFNPQEKERPRELKHLSDKFRLDLKQWPPLWKPIKESPQYLLGIINTIVNDTFNLETRLKNNVRQSELYLPFKRFVQQVKESRGYDVDKEYPGCPFLVITDVYERIEECSYYEETLAQEMVYVLAKINTHARLHQKRYELLKIERIMRARGNRTDLMTIRVKEVELGSVDVAENVDVINANEIALANVDMAKHIQTMMKTKEVALENVDHVVKTIQAMVFASTRGFYRLTEWRFKPEGEGSPALEVYDEV